MQDVFELKKCSDFGRYLIAKKEFKSGELIFVESPIVVFPDSSDFKTLKRRYTCLGCFRIFEILEVFRCSHCKWPACSERCANDETHRQLECGLLKSSGIAWTPKVINYLYILRSLLIKDLDPVKWSQIMALSSKHEWEDSDVHFELEESRHRVHLRHFLKKRLNLRVTSKRLKQLISIFAINSFGYSDLQSKNRNKTLLGYGMIFATTSFIAHSCSPNLEWTIPKSYDECHGKWYIRLYSKRDIKIGEMLTIAYTTDYLRYGTVERRDCMLNHFQFFCRCERCNSPSELGSYFSGVQCSKCDKGWVLPHCNWNVKSFCMTTKYICENCHKSHCVEDIWDLEVRFDKHLTNVIKNRNEFEGSRQKMLDVLISNAKKIYRLHPNHHLVIQAILHWASVHELKILLETSEESKFEFEKIMERAHRGRFVYKYLGNATNYAKMEACLATAMSLFHFKSDDYLSIRQDIYSPPEKLQLIRKIVQHMSDAMRFVDGRNYNYHADKLVKVLKMRLIEWKKHLNECEESVSNESMQNACNTP